MEKKYCKYYSKILERDMEFNVYGTKGLAILVFPAQNGRFFDYEGFKMTDVIADKIDAGVVQLFCCDSIDLETWSDEYGNPRHRIEMHEKWYHYICDELVPLIHEMNPESVTRRILTTGCSMGGTHCLNFMLRRPDLFCGTIALSGYYDSEMFFKNYYDDLIYNNTPTQYLAGMSPDHPYVEAYNKSCIIVCCGQGAWEDEMRECITKVETQFKRLGVNAIIDRWGFDVNHDWPWWQKQLPYFLNKVLEGGY